MLNFGAFRLGARAKAATLIALTILLLFFSIALYTPLHRHSPGKGCSFNNLEHQWYALLEFAVMLLVLFDLGLREIREEFDSALRGAIRIRRGRGPPLTR